MSVLELSGIQITFISISNKTEFFRMAKFINSMIILSVNSYVYEL